MRGLDRLALAVLIFLSGTAGSAEAQLVNMMHGSDGLSLPCVTVGPLAPIAQEYCVDRTAKEGFLRGEDLGHSGLVVGDKGDTDGMVTAVETSGPREVPVGSVVVSVDGKPAAWSGAEIGRMVTFGPRNDVLKLTLNRDGMVIERTIKRAPEPEPANTPHSPNPLIGIHPVTDWRGVFVPCMGVGPAGLIAINACQAKLRGRGYVKTTDLGATGLTFDEHRGDRPVVAAVSGPAEQADIKPGDVITAVNGKPIQASIGLHVNEMLFGKIGETRMVTVRRDGRDTTVTLVLAKKG